MICGNRYAARMGGLFYMIPQNLVENNGGEL